MHIFTSCAQPPTVCRRENNKNGKMKRKILRIIIYDKSLIIKALIMSLALHSSILTAQSEQNITEMYVVNDPDGYTNLRDESGMQSQIIQRLANKRIVYRDPDKEIENGWIPVSFVDNSEHIVHFSGYTKLGHILRYQTVGILASINYPFPFFFRFATLSEESCL